MADLPDLPDVPELADSPESAEAAEAPELPEASVTPELPETPETSELPEAPVARPSRTARLLVGALVLGPLLGAGLGYGIQAARPATPLPPLALQQLHYPAKPLDAKTAAEIAPKPLAIDGDLRKLLIAKPDGYEDWDDFGYDNSAGWLTAGELARTYGHSDNEFRSLLSNGFRRDAAAFFKKGDVKYRVELLQYSSDRSASAITAATVFRANSKPIPGTVDGIVSTPAVAKTYAESTEQFYEGEAIARRGDLVMRISVFAPSQVNSDELMDIAKRQWERLA